MAKRVEPQKRGEGGRFVKRATAAADPPDPGPPTIDYDPPPEPAVRARKTAARAGKKPAARAPSSPAKRARKNTARAGETHETEPAVPKTASTGRPLGFMDGLLGPLGLRRG